MSASKQGFDFELQISPWCWFQQHVRMSLCVGISCAKYSIARECWPFIILGFSLSSSVGTEMKGACLLDTWGEGCPMH
jgi:hypothetical protein